MKRGRRAVKERHESTPNLHYIFQEHKAKGPTLG